MNAITQGNILKSLLKFFFPILLGTFFQQFYNTIDAIVVGRFAGKEALASVGGSAAVFVQLLVGFFMGLTSGGEVLISQFHGAKNSSLLKKSIETSILMSVFGGFIMTFVGIIFARPILNLTKCPEEILNTSAEYLTIFFSGLIPMFVYNMCAGILRAQGDSKTPLLILIIGCFSNIFLDLFFVIFLKKGITGVALATVICQIESAIISLYILKRRKKEINFLKLKIDFPLLIKTLKIGIPSGLQGSLYVISNLIIQTNINHLGTDSVAGWAIYGKIDVLFWMTTSTLGIALTTFSGQNFGAKQYKRIIKATWITIGLSFASTLMIIFLFMNYSKNIFLLFTKDKAVLEKAVEMVRYLSPFYIAYISIEILSGCIRGTGKTFTPTIITVFGVCGLRLLWLFLVVPANQNIQTIIFTYPLTWIVTSTAFWIYFLSKKWLTKN